MKKVAWCVLTYNNSEVIYDIWKNNIYLYKEMGIDIYIFLILVIIITQKILLIAI